MSYLSYLCVFVYSGVQHILGCVPFFFGLSSSCFLGTQGCLFLWIVHSWLSLRFSLPFIIVNWCSTFKLYLLWCSYLKHKCYSWIQLLQYQIYLNWLNQNPRKYTTVKSGSRKEYWLLHMYRNNSSLTHDIPLEHIILTPNK